MAIVDPALNIAPVVGLVMVTDGGASGGVVTNETLSTFAEQRVVVLWLVTARPTETLAAITSDADPT